MFLDARGVADRSVLDADVCVVGAGPAGIALARDLARRGVDVLVLESGGLEYEPETQELAVGEVAGHAYPPLESTRVRAFGGTTAHWNGWCRPLDAVDFAERPGVPHSGWPIAFDDVEPYYVPAQRICQLGPYDYGGEHWARATGMRVLPLASDAFQTTVFQFSPPTRFGAVYRAELRASESARVLLHANATLVGTSERGNRIEHVEVATLTGRRF